MNKRQENSQTPSHKICSQLCSILSSGNIIELETFLSKYENLSSEVLVKSIFTLIKEQKVAITQIEPLQILFRLFLKKIIMINFLKCFSRFPIVNEKDDQGNKINKNNGFLLFYYFSFFYVLISFIFNPEKTHNWILLLKTNKIQH